MNIVTVTLLLAAAAKLRGADGHAVAVVDWAIHTVPVKTAWPFIVDAGITSIISEIIAIRIPVLRIFFIYSPGMLLCISIDFPTNMVWEQLLTPYSSVESSFGFAQVKSCFPQSATISPWFAARLILVRAESSLGDLGGVQE